MHRCFLYLFVWMLVDVVTTKCALRIQDKPAFYHKTVNEAKFVMEKNLRRVLCDGVVRQTNNNISVNFTSKGFHPNTWRKAYSLNHTVVCSEAVSATKNCNRSLTVSILNSTFTVGKDKTMRKYQNMNYSKPFLNLMDKILISTFRYLIAIDESFEYSRHFQENCSKQHIEIVLYNNSICETTRIKLPAKRSLPFKNKQRQNANKLVPTELSNICKEFQISDPECICSLFRLGHEIDKEKKFQLCILLSHEKEEIIPSMKETDKSYIPHIMHRACRLLNVSKDDCVCNKIQVYHAEDLKKDICKFYIETEVNVGPTIEEICDLFLIPRNDCDCKLFGFDAQENLNQSFCEFHRSMNRTMTVFVKLYAHDYVKPFAIIATISSCLGIIGNGLVVFMAVKLRNSLPRCKKLFAVLALSDLIFAIIQFFHIVPKYHSYVWEYGRVMCKLLKTSEQLGSMVAIGIILIISIERYVGILEPFQGGMPKRVLLLLLAGNVVLAAAAVTPVLKYNDVDETGMCRPIWQGLYVYGLLYDTCLMLVYYVIPLTTICVLYTKIALNLRGTLKIDNDLWIADPRLRSKRYFENRRTMYILITIVVAFAVLVFPYHIVDIYFAARFWNGVYVSSKKIDISTYFALQYFKYLPYPLHVTVNPIIYCLIDSKWRKDLLLMAFNIPRRARAYSAMLSTNRSIHSHQRSSNVDSLNQPIESLQMETFASLRLRRETVEESIANPLLRSVIPKRTKHCSFSSTKSVESDC